jgi:hypothetical protein
LLVDDIWLKDLKKKNLLENAGFAVMEVWFRKNSDRPQMLRNCIEFIERQCNLHGIHYEKISCDKKDLHP